MIAFGLKEFKNRGRIGINVVVAEFFLNESGTVSVPVECCVVSVVGEPHGFCDSPQVG